ncbi:MAG: ABC transporter ATP-binding protein [Synechococcales cyanobacterium CRU_2_2]|nr:ABC transporter ATP-binding protein [Synechococcales cyanobacterium CRU_2_2]
MASRSRLHKLFEYLKPHWRPTTLGIIALLVVNILAVMLPRIIGNCVDEIRSATTVDMAVIIRYALWVLGLASIMLVFRLLSRQLIFGVGRQVEFDLKQRIFQHLLTMEPAYFSENTIGDLINRATSDVDNIRRLLGFAVLSLINTLLAYLFVLPAMLTTHFRLSVLAIAIYPIMLLTVQLFSDKLRNQQENVQEGLSEMSELIQEDMSGISLIKIYAQENNERRAFGRLNQQLLDANLMLAKTRNFLFPLLEGLTSLSLLVVLWMGSRAIAAGTLTVGDFVSLMLYVQQLVFPTALLGFTITAYQRGEVSVDRVEAILIQSPKIQNVAQAQPLSAIAGSIKADRLSFTYPGASAPALNKVSFVIEPHQTVAIVGPVGAGKSTLANALPRLINIAPGQLYLDGADVTQIALKDLRAAIAYVPQDSFLFSSTIRDNIRYGDPLKEEPAVRQAAIQAQIHPEIENFPQHYDTLVGERGITLSGGQRQRTALARALLVDAPILILDDALSSVDNQTATQILRQLSAGTQRKTVIFISHQMSAAASADLILVMDRGQIVQSGRHSELMVEAGLYRSLWERQQLEAQLG